MSGNGKRPFILQFAVLSALAVTTAVVVTTPDGSPITRIGLSSDRQDGRYGGHHAGDGADAADTVDDNGGQVKEVDAESDAGDASDPETAPASRIVGPVATDFIDIRKVGPSPATSRRGRRASTGTFVSSCGTNQGKHQNTDNVIIAPGVPDGAQHLHDYVGNLSTDAFSTDQSLAAAGTTCRVRSDRSSYFWPVVRVRRRSDPAGVAERGKNNIGTPVLPARVLLQYKGNARSKVTAMPKFLRLFSGDAKTVSNGTANARPTWTCTGFTDRLTDKYPLCPRRSRLVRVYDMPSCWDGKGLDSPNHRTHAVFPQANGACPPGTRAIPQLRMVLIYNGVPNTPPSGSQVPFAVDGFATERHRPDTDHAGYINVMTPRLSSAIARCINAGRRC